jgi:hypothetical protein
VVGAAAQRLQRSQHYARKRNLGLIQDILAHAVR